MSAILVNSLERLYKKGKVSEEKIRMMVEKLQISKEEYEQITGVRHEDK